ncbi:MAG: ATP-binding cassette domain-containing protein [Ruminococcaceae bacterium]|nr:ATP-binding cassette domain-containing protein [Oscillospiraceae bacterium]
MIEIKNLVKRYGSNLAVDDISFTVNDGEIVGFLGPNGAGKSTTMNILTGYLSATDGQCLIGGVDILQKPIAAKRKIGYLPELPPVYLEMTVREYLNFVYDLKKCTLNRKKHIDEICDVVKITDVQHRLIGNLSKGYRQRVGFAQALVGNPEVMIFDEPTVGLDPVQIIEIRNLIKSLGKNHTVILSTHILSEVQAVCDRIVVINKGKIVANATPAELDKLSGVSSRSKLKITGESDNVIAALKTVEGVTDVELSEKCPEQDCNIYIVTGDSSEDIKKKIFFTLAARQMAILSFEACSSSIEDIFISLVSKNYAENVSDTKKDIGKSCEKESDDTVKSDVDETEETTKADETEEKGEDN